MCCATQQSGLASEEDVDYILLGAGMSGIFMLAEALQQDFKSVVVLDRKDR